MPEQEAEELLIQILLLGVKDGTQWLKTEGVFYSFPLSAQQPNVHLPAPDTLSEGCSLATEAHFAHLCGGCRCPGITVPPVASSPLPTSLQPMTNGSYCIHTKAPLPRVGYLTARLHWLPESQLSSSCPHGRWLDNVQVPFFVTLVSLVLLLVFL